MDDLLTIKDLAKHWKCHEETIRENIRQGVISPCKGVPIKNRFNPNYILELDGVDLEKFSPILKRNMEREIKRLKEENQKLKDMLMEQVTLGNRCFQLLNEKEKI
ncbi:histidine kinase [Clostridium sp. LP20]|uniref:histidine kinase n=1 Tax=Clostridium sp. LP20 TaxID=3418665 RepID=UPI003EE47A06